MSRKGLEFKNKVKLEIFKRAGGPDNIRCEGCGLLLRGKPFDYDHDVEIWELPSELREKFRKEGVPAEYGQLLGKACCHKPKTAQKTAERTRCDNLLKKAAKTKKKSGGFKGWRKFDGTVVWNNKK